MKTLSAFVLACALTGAAVCGAQGLTFDTVQPVNRNRVMTISGISRKNLQAAMDLHNLIVEVRDIDNVRQQLMLAVRTRQVQEARLDALEKCSIQKLSEQFKNPEEVWDKMKAEYAKREKDMTIYVNSTEDATDEQRQAFERYMESGEMTQEVVAELLAPWQIGQEILIDVYQNQDAWGERKNAKAPSFQLWEDQKFQFDQEWDDAYTKINAYFGVPAEGRPTIGDEKYDYARTQDVEKAHKDYLKRISAKAPNKLASLPEEWKKPPVAPRPLPPKNEIVVYLDADQPENQVYPALPAPWQKYAEQGFKNVNPNGEMAQDFSEGLTVKEAAKNAGRGNRLSTYAGLKQSVDGTNQIEDMVLDNAEGHVGRLQRKITKYIPLDIDTDLVDPDVQKTILTQLQTKLKELLALADAEMNQRVAEEEDDYQIPQAHLEDIEDLAALKELNPTVFEDLKQQMPPSIYEQDKRLLTALKADPEGRVFINEVNAGDVDKMLQESDAVKAFMDDDDWEKEIALAFSVPIDDTCLNGGM